MSRKRDMGRSEMDFGWEAVFLLLAGEWVTQVLVADQPGDG